MTPQTDMTWDLTALAYCGGFVGAMLAIGHNLYTILSGDFDATYPFRYVMLEAVIFATVGAILAVAMGAAYRLLQQRL
jgi:hypothetical protein